jgi:hypothetical protein
MYAFSVNEKGQKSLFSCWYAPENKNHQYQCIANTLMLNSPVLGTALLFRKIKFAVVTYLELAASIFLAENYHFCHLHRLQHSYIIYAGRLRNYRGLE